MKKITFLISFLLTGILTQAQLIVHVGDKINGNVTVTAVDESSDSYWVGTDIGLYRVSKAGKDYTYYSVSNSSLQSNHVTTVCCRQDGDVWIGTTKGILLYDTYSFTTIDVDNSKLPENHVTSMKEDSNDDLWIGTLKSGLVKVHRNRFYLFNENNSTLVDNNVHSIITNQENKLVVSLSQNEAMLLSAIVKK